MPTNSVDPFTLFGNSFSGNCLKPKWVADYLGLTYTWKEVDLLERETRTSEFLKLNPAGQVPVVQWSDGRVLTQSNAIIMCLAEGAENPLIPSGQFAKAEMLSWLFWEQYSHEPAIAVRRWQKKYQKIPEDEIDPNLFDKGYQALRCMEETLQDAIWFVRGGFTLADIALVAYTRVAHEGGFDLLLYPHIRDWIDRVENKLNISSVQMES